MTFPDMELVIFVGLQASGKSTFFRERLAPTHEHVSKDLFRNNRNRNRRQAQLIEDALEAGRSVVVDNTNPTPEDRRVLIGLGGEYGARIVGYYFDASVRACLRRNAGREGKARVPSPSSRRPRGWFLRPTRRVSTGSYACAWPTTLPSRSASTRWVRMLFPRTGPREWRM